MTLLQRFSVLALLFCGLQPALAAQQKHLAAQESTRNRELGTSIQDFMRRAWAHGFSGAALVAIHGEVVSRVAYGELDKVSGRAVKPTTAFDIASLDKQFIAAAILRLEEMGKLSTNDRLDRFFDYIPADKKQITLNQLLSHTSGLPNVYWDEHLDLTTREQFVRYCLVDVPLESKPGTEWSYSNSGYVVLEEIIARASGEPYEVFLRKQLFLPSGMTRTGLRQIQWGPDSVAKYQFWTGEIYSRHGADLTDPLKRSVPESSLLSTVDDLYRWYLALRNDKVLSKASKKKLFTPVKDDYAYGWNIAKTSRGTTLIFHGGSESKLGMLSTFRYYPDEDVLIVFLSNSAHPGLSGEYLGGDIEQLVFGGSPNFPAAIVTSPANKDPIEGTYALPSGATIRVRAIPGDRLVLSTQDERSALLLRFPDSGAPVERIPQDQRGAQVIEGISRGDFGPLKASLPSVQAF